jgi:8-oxo-dGTP diphosphatase
LERRECLEETGWRVLVTGVRGGQRSGPRVHIYPNGERVHFLGVVFAADVAELVGRPDGEVVEVGFFASDNLPQPVFAPDRPVLIDLVLQRPTPVIA